MPNLGTDPATIEQALTRFKSVTTTLHETRAAREKPAEVVKGTRVQLHSPLQAAAALARLADMGPTRETTPKPSA